MAAPARFALLFRLTSDAMRNDAMVVKMVCAAVLLAACGNKKSEQGGASGSAGSATATGAATVGSGSAAAGSSAAADGSGSAAGSAVAAPSPALPDGYSLVAKDETGGGKDELLRSSAQRQMAALPAGPWELRVSLKKNDKTTTGLTCAVSIMVLSKPEMNMKATLNAGATTTHAADDAGLTECLDAVIGNLVTTKLTTVVGAGAGSAAAGSAGSGSAAN